MDPITLALAKQYTDSVAFGGGGSGGNGDMLKSVYDTNSNGVVDDSERLGGQTPDFYAAAEDLPVNVSELENDAGYQTETQVDNAISAKGYQTEAQVDAKVNAKLSSVYRPQGSVLFANLPELTADKEGYVYNVSDSFTSDERFLGDSQDYPAGTNVVVVNADGVYKFSSLAGVFDMSNFQTKIRGRKGYFVGFIEQDEVGEMDSAPNKNTKTARFVIGTSTAGWTQEDCDYLCDGADDQTEINAAIQALLETGGEIKLLDGVYTLSGQILVNKENVKISGCGFNTVIKNISALADYNGIFEISENNCILSNLKITAESDGLDTGCGVHVFKTEGLTGVQLKNLHVLAGKSSIVFNAGVSNSIISECFVQNGQFACIETSVGTRNIVSNNICFGGQFGINIYQQGGSIYNGNEFSDFTVTGINLYESNYCTVVCNNVALTAGSSANVNGNDNLICANNFSTKAPVISGARNLVDNNL